MKYRVRNTGGVNNWVYRDNQVEVIFETDDVNEAFHRKQVADNRNGEDVRSGREIRFVVEEYA